MAMEASQTLQNEDIHFEESKTAVDPRSSTLNP